jgi:hypothetical protein
MGFYVIIINFFGIILQKNVITDENQGKPWTFSINDVVLL